MKRPQASVATGTRPEWTSPEDVAAIVAGTHGDAFGVLGLHEADKGLVARAFVPHAEFLEALTLAGKPVGELQRVDDAGFFEGRLTLKKRQPIRYRARNAGGEWTLADPYSFGPVLGPMDDYYIAEGSHLRLFDKLGAHLIEHEGAFGVHFAVWAPNARRVSVVGDFNDWDGRRHPMRLRQDTGIWEIFIPDIGQGRPYKFEIVGADGVRLPLKADPFAFRSELRPATASVTDAPPDHEWGDEAHRAYWRSANARREPISIYEVHAGSWQRRDDGTLPVLGRAGRPADPLRRRDGLHPHRVPADHRASLRPVMGLSDHRPLRAHRPLRRAGRLRALRRRRPPRRHRRHPRLGAGAFPGRRARPRPLRRHRALRARRTRARASIRTGTPRSTISAVARWCPILVNNALYWAEKYHLDGLRVDAVASMLYLDYSRKAGEWIPNEKGGRENLDAVEFLQRMNVELYGHQPGVITIAEEFDLLAQGVAAGLRGRARLRLQVEHGLHARHAGVHGPRADPPHAPPRRDHLRPRSMPSARISCCRFSHDEVVHGKGSLLAKMSGDDWQKFANLRAYYGFMWGYPGKKLLFMGQEFAQRDEWSEERALDWGELDHRAASRRRQAGARPQLPLPLAPGAACPRLRAGGLRMVDRRRSTEFGLRLAAQGAGRQPRSRWSRTSPRCRATTTGCRCHWPAPGARS